MYQNKKLGFKIVGKLKNFDEQSQKQIEKIADKFGIDELIQTDTTLPQEEKLGIN